MAHTKKILVGLFILSAAIRIFVMLSCDNFAGNVPMGRVAHALSILENQSLNYNFDASSPVLYHYMLAAVLRIWPDPLVAPRVFTMFFGILTIIPFYLLIRLLFNERIAFFSSIFLAFYPLHAIQSSISTSDALAHFFLISCLYYIFKFKQGERKIFRLIVSAVCFNLAAALRFEVWTIAPLLAIFLYQQNRKRYCAMFFFLSLIVPILWLYLCSRYTGNALYTFNAAARTAHAEILLRVVPYSQHILGWANILHKTLGHFVFFAGVCGILYSLIHRESLHLVAIFLFIYSLYAINTASMRMWYVERYSIILGLLLLPYSALWIEKLSRVLRFNPMIFFLPLAFIAAIEFKTCFQTSLPAFTLPTGIREVASWLKLNARLTDKLIVGSDYWDVSDQDIIVRSGISRNNFYVVSTPLARPETGIKEVFKWWLATHKPRFLVFNSTGFLQNKILHFDIDAQNINEYGFRFNRVYFRDLQPGFGRYTVYEIRYPEYEGKLP